jgi:prephenate dehydrogenase
MEIGIVGGTRGMGRWLARVLLQEGYTVHAWGRSEEREMEERIPSCQVVFVSVPLEVVSEVLEKVGPMVKRGSGLMDLSSLKEEPVATMLKCSSSEVVGIHPLFGPKVRSLKGKKVVFCRGRGEKWLGWAKNLFEKRGARILEMDPGEHDWKMAKIQLLTHLNTMVLGVSLGELGESLVELLDISTPVFERKARMLRRVFWENPRLYSALVAMNPHLSRILEVYTSALGRISRALGQNGPEKLRSLMEDTRRALEGGPLRAK